MRIIYKSLPSSYPVVHHTWILYFYILKYLYSLPLPYSQTDCCRIISAVIPESCLSIWFDIFGKEWRIWKKKLYLDIVKKQLISFQQTPEAAVRDILKYQYTNSSKLLFKFDKKKEVEICASYHCLDVYIFIRKLMYSLICNQNETYFFDYCCGYWLFHVFLPSHLQHFL